MPRVPFKICVTRLVGTSIFRASSAALISSASSSAARCSPGWIAVSAIATLLVIVDNLHVPRPRRSVSPLEANPPLIVYADAVLALAVTYQRFKTVSRQRSEIADRGSRLQTIKLQARGPLKAREYLDPLTAGEFSGSLIPIADDHYL